MKQFVAALKSKMIVTMSKINTKQITIREVLCNQRGSNTVEYLLLAAAAVVLILTVGLPAMKSLFNVDIFPGLQDKVKEIFDFT